MTLDAEAMRAIAPAIWPALRLTTHPAAAILALDWRVSELLSAIEENREWKPAHRGDVKVLVGRRHARVFHRELEPAEVRAIAALSRGATFARICGLVAADAGAADPVAEVNRLLARWLADGILVIKPRAPRRAPKRELGR